MARAAAAQRSWRDRALPERLEVIARFRRRLAADAGALAAGVSVRPPVETLAAEILPLLECCRFLERRARSVLRSARRSGREPLWLRGTVVEVVREPFGIVLIVGPGNYGLMLAGIQALHALAAGNAVIVKPAPGSRPVLERFAALLAASGLPADVLAIAERVAADRSRAARERHRQARFYGFERRGPRAAGRAAAKVWCRRHSSCPAGMRASCSTTQI